MMLLIDGAAWSQERSEEQGDRKTQRELCCLERGEGRHGRRSVELLRGEAPENKHEEPRFLKNGPGVPAGWQGHIDDACDRRCGMVPGEIRRARRPTD